MFETIGSWLSSDAFMPHGMCYLWKPELLWLHVVSDAVIAASYLTIPPVIVYLVWRARRIMAEGEDGGEGESRGLPHEWMFVAFGTFIVACGVTHIVSIVTVWQPVYWVSGGVKAVTAVASIGTALALPPLLPHIFTLVRTARDSERNMLDLEAQATELARSNRDLDDFAHVASHDLKAPLRGIDRLAMFIEEDAGELLPSESRRDLATLRGRVERLDALLDGVLEYARLGGPPDAVTTDVGDVIDEVVDLYVPADRFRVTKHGPLPAIPAARTNVEILFRNLVMNTVKHHDQDRGEIRITGDEAADGIRYTVEDDGPGVPTRHATRVFELFQTLRPRDEVEGSGMGLAFVRKVMETSGGTVHLEPRDGRGALFHLWWPTTEERRAPSGRPGVEDAAAERRRHRSREMA